MSTILNHQLISERYLFPRPAHLKNPTWVKCADGRLACYYHRPHPGAKTIVHFHGNGEIVSDYLGDFLTTIEQLGYNCFLAEYRGYGMSTGKPALQAMLDDVELIIEAIDQPPEELVLFGRSLGSLYAIHGVSLFPTIPGLILESGIADLLERLLLRVVPAEIGVTEGQLQAAASEHFNHPGKLLRYQGASLIMHSRNDGLVDLSHAERLYQWLPEPKTLKIFDQGNHNSVLLVNFEVYFQQVQQFLQSLSDSDG